VVVDRSVWINVYEKEKDTKRHCRLILGLCWYMHELAESSDERKLVKVSKLSI
jgi:hypothetical protein